MGDNSKIEWTNDTWNPVRGCSIVSKGCTNCYAMRQAHRHARAGGAYEGLTMMSRGGPVWTGEVQLVRKLLEWPLGKKEPRRIFVNSMSDLFHDKVPWEYIDAVFGVMALADRHQFQVLTKRPKRMLEYFRGRPSMPASQHAEGRAAHRAYQIAQARGEKVDAPNWDMWWQWPLPNVWLGVSVEDQAAANERIPLLLQTPAAIRWISAEPLLEEIDIEAWLPAKNIGGPGEQTLEGLDWVVAGGESGPGARPMHPAWVRSLRDQCQRWDVAFFFKQWGAWAPFTYIDGNTGNRLVNLTFTKREIVIGGPAEGTTPYNMKRVGKKAAGRELDGALHDEYPA